jgi:NAD(P)H-flavin reductase
MQFAPPKQYKARLEDKIQHNPKFVQYMFELTEPNEMPFVAGQYVSIKVNDQGERRSYSICSSPAITHGFELAVDVSPGGLGCQYLEALQFGQTIELLGPMGRFVVTDQDLELEPALIFVATGSGIAPFYSMLADLLQVRHDSRPMVLYWGVRHEDELFWLLEFQQLTEHFANFSFHPVISKPGSEWTLCAGRVTDCLTNHGVTQPAGYYLCGNKPMIEDVTSLLNAAGVALERIHHEKFY